MDDDYLALCMEELAKPGPGGIYQNLRVIYIKLLQNIALQKVQAATPAAVGGAALSIDK